jgi:hypothetical protein
MVPGFFYNCADVASPFKNPDFPIYSKRTMGHAVTLTLPIRRIVCHNKSTVGVDIPTYSQYCASKRLETFAFHWLCAHISLFIASLFLVLSVNLSSMPDIMASGSARFLQSQRGMQGSAVLTIIYLLILTMCFLVPMLYYFWLRCQDQQLRQRNREIEAAHVAITVRASVEDQTETRALRKKFRAERLARIVQLFGPVSMVSL